MPSPPESDPAMPRIPYADPDALPEDYPILDEQEAALPEEIDADWWNAQPTVRTFANNPALAETHVHANVSMWTKTGLSPREVEFVILAVAREIGSDYEWHDHVIAAVERAGLTREEVLAVSRRNTDALAASERTLVEYTFEFVREYGEVSEQRFASLADHYDDSTRMGITMLAGYYVFLHHVAAALGLKLEEEFVGWELENY